jgi:hypothetical protein
VACYRGPGEGGGDRRLPGETGDDAGVDRLEEEVGIMDLTTLLLVVLVVAVLGGGGWGYSRYRR